MPKIPLTPLAYNKIKALQPEPIRRVTFNMTRFINIYQYDNKACNEAIIRAIREEGGTLTRETVVKAYMTDWILKLDHNAEPYSDFFAFINNSLTTSIHKLSGVTKEKIRYRFANIWGAIYKDGDYTQSHSHAPTQISFVYYLMADPIDSSPLVFDEIDYSITPKTGMLVMCPGWLTHHVPPYKPLSVNDRIVLAGNIEML